MKAMSVVAVALVLGAAAAIAQTSPIRPGRWEVTMQMQMANSPIQLPEMKTTQCVTPEQIKDPASALPQAAGAGRGGQTDCKVSDYKVSGNTATWQMSCTKPQAITSAGEMTFTADTYNGTIKSNMAQGEMTMKVAGKRLGDCEK
jgi:hypothetical protein